VRGKIKEREEKERERCSVRRPNPLFSSILFHSCFPLSFYLSPFFTGLAINLGLIGFGW
jgi:hypothetical protein